MMHTIAINPAEQAAQTDEQPARELGYAWYVTAVLSIAYMFSQIDRMIINLLVEPIKQDLGLTDTQISVLLGFAFSLSVAIAGIPIARIADRTNRRNVAAIGIVFWSMMTCISGLAINFVQLFFARFGLGIGEAALTPASYSILSDYFPKARLARAMGYWMIGGIVGVAAAMIGGGYMIGKLVEMGPVDIPFFGLHHAWQLAFPIVGAPALLVGMWVFTLREPVRGRFAPVSADRSHAGRSELLRFFRANKATTAAIFMGFSLLILVSHALTSWFPTFLIRQFDYTIAESGIALGLALGGFGLIGCFATGPIVERLGGRGHPDAPLRAGMFAAIGLTVCAGLAPLAPNASLAVALFCPAIVLIVVPVVTAAVAIQQVAPVMLRAQITALYFFVTAIVGGGLGPLVVALLTDQVFGRADAINYSLAIVSLVISPISALILGFGLAPFRRSLAAAEAESPVTG